MELKSALSIISLVLLTGFLFVDGFIKDKALEENESLVASIRENRTQTMDNFMIVFSILVSPEVVIGCLFLFYFLSRDKVNSLTFIIVIALCGYIDNVLKLIYQQPRPYMIYPSINLLGKCEKGLGHPSGHAFSGTVYVLLAADLLIHELEFGKKRMIDIDLSIISQLEKEQKTKVWHYILYIFAFCFCFMVGFSRIYLGAHSYEQILSGWAYASVFLILYYNFLQEFIGGLLKDAGENKSFIVFKKSFGLIAILFINFCTLSLCIVLFITMANESQRVEWQNKMSTMCKKDPGFIILDRKALMDCGVFGIVFGLFVGAYFSKGEVDEFHIYTKNTKPLTFFKKIARLLIIVAFFGINFLIYSLFKMVNEIYVCFLFGSWINFFCFGFSLTFLIPIIFNKFSLTYPGDFMKITVYEYN